MDPILVFTYVIIIVSVLAFIIIVIAINIRQKGFTSRTGVKKWLTYLDDDKYKVLNNVKILSHGGKFVKVDFIVVSVYGIFVIVTNKYKGWISGSESSPKWTQKKFNRTYSFDNPVLKAKGHISNLKTILYDQPILKYIPIVVFKEKADLSRLIVRSHVIYPDDILKVIFDYTEEHIITVDPEEISFKILSASSETGYADYND